MPGVSAPCFSPAGCQGLCWKAPRRARHNAAVCTRMLAVAWPCAGTWHLHHRYNVRFSALRVQRELKLQFARSLILGSCAELATVPTSRHTVVAAATCCICVMLFAPLKLHSLQHTLHIRSAATHRAVQQHGRHAGDSKQRCADFVIQTVKFPLSLAGFVSTRRCGQQQTLFCDGYPSAAIRMGPRKTTAKERGRPAAWPGASAC